MTSAKSLVCMQESYNFYEISSLREIIGNDDAVRRMVGFSSDIENGKTRAPLLVFGPPGSGKTAAVHALAKERGWNVVELNASDYRDRESIERTLVAASKSRTLFHERNLILLDEIDELAPRFDKGAGAAIAGLIADSKNPVILIANDMWDQSISFLRGKVEPVEFKRLAPLTITRVIANICKRFSIKLDDEVADIIANRSNGDARSAINDVSVMMGSKEDITEVIGLRDRKTDVFRVLDRIFLTDVSRAMDSQLRSIPNTDLTNEMLINWIDENVPKRYVRKEEMKRAFDSLSCASMFSTRAARSQYYTYWRYMNVFMLSGVALSKTGSPDTRERYAFPKFIKDLSATKADRRKEVEIAEKLQKHFHSSVGRIRENEMKMLARIMKSAMKTEGATKGDLEDELMRRFQLDEKEVEYVSGMHN